MCVCIYIYIYICIYIYIYIYTYQVVLFLLDDGMAEDGIKDGSRRGSKGSCGADNSSSYI